MKILHRLRFRLSLVAALVATSLPASIAMAQDLRIVTWNINADTGGGVGQYGGVDGGPGLSAVLQAIGQEHLNGNAQPIDVLALEELNGTGANAANATNATLEYVVGELNAIYGAGTYAYDTTTDPTDGAGDTGNGPSGLIYNTKTVVDLGAMSIGTVGSSGAARAPMQYHLAPAANPSDTFYMYVEHSLSGTTSEDANRREVEASEVRSAAAELPANANIIYSGDFNFNASTDASYQTMVASGQGQAFDVANPAENWQDTSAYQGIMTETATHLEYRDDAEFVNSAVLNGTYGLHIVSNSYTAFGNNGTTPFDESVTTAGNTALSDLSDQQTILTDLTTATDHLPIVADYAFLAAPEPGAFYSMAVAALPLLWTAMRRARRARG